MCCGIASVQTLQALLSWRSRRRRGQHQAEGGSLWSARSVQVLSLRHIPPPLYDVWMSRDDWISPVGAGGFYSEGGATARLVAIGCFTVRASGGISLWDSRCFRVFWYSKGGIIIWIKLIQSHQWKHCNLKAGGRHVFEVDDEGRRKGCKDNKSNQAYSTATQCKKQNATKQLQYSSAAWAVL